MRSVAPHDHGIALRQEEGNQQFWALDGAEDVWSKFKHGVHDNVDAAAHKIAHGGDAKDEPDTANLYKEINDLKHRCAADEAREEEAREKAKYHDGWTAHLVTNKKFEGTTLLFIVFNAAVIGWDSDYTARNGAYSIWDADAPIEFLLCENTFAAYFTFEIVVRFLAYKVKWHCLCDMWFVFDATLVTFMVVETWLMPFLMGSGGPLGQLSILRLLRLLRISRMAKLMRAFPELMMIMKGITAAMKAVVWTVILLVIVTYTWAILLTNEYHQGLKEDIDVEDGAEVMFGSMGKSMLSLLVMGTILDDVTACADTIRSTDNLFMLAAFIMYILINSFTMMNMLVGILVEVVGNTAEGEQTRGLEESVKDNIMSIFKKMDKDNSGMITRAEFWEFRDSKIVMSSLASLDIQEKQFDMYVELLFLDDSSGNEPTISFEKLLNMILRLRPGTPVSALDFASFKQLVLCGHEFNRESIQRLDYLIDVIRGDAVEPYQASVNEIMIDAAADLPENEATLRCQEPPVDDPERQVINVNMLAQLDVTDSADIICELQRRLGMSNLEETGVPLAMMDEHLQARVRAADAFQTLGVPQSDPEWSKETMTC